MVKINKNKRISRSDSWFYGINGAILVIVLLLTLYPLILVLSSSFSSPNAVTSGKVWLFPVDFSLEGYQAVFKNSHILSGYKNSLIYMISGTIINVSLTILIAYPLSRRDMFGRNFIMYFISFTMLFTGGLIPTYLVVNKLGMVNTIWAMILPNAIWVWNVIITRTYYQTTIASSLLEAAKVDGCNDFKFMLSIVLPLSKPITAVIALYYAVGHWNSFFQALIYLSKDNMYPLQIILRDILVQNSIDGNMMDPELEEALAGLAELLKYSLIVVASAPVLCLYPFVQKYFVKGVMIGALKG